VATDEDRGKDHQDEVFSFHYDLQSGAPRIDQPGFVYALTLLQRLQPYRPAGTSATPAEAFRDGRAVLCLTDASWLPVFQQKPDLRDKFGICRMPGGGCYFDYRTGTRHPAASNRVPYLGSSGWLALVPGTAPHAEAAFALLADLSGPERSAQVSLEPRWGGGPLRDDQLNRERWDAFDLDGTRTAALKETLQQTLLHRQMKNPVLCLRIPDQAAHRAALVKEVRAALAGQATPEQALKAAARRWSDLDRARGMEAHRADYRISLGLLPR
jgi:ABC-type glycerol-3-phosphate transport system substrate-binding protein